MKKIFLVLLLSAIIIPVIGMEKEDANLPSNEQTDGQDSTRVPLGEIRSYFNEFEQFYADPFFMLDYTNSFMTYTEIEEWFNADSKGQFIKGLEAWVRFRIACRDGRFGDNYQMAKHAYREFLRNDPQAANELPKPKFSMKTPGSSSVASSAAATSPVPTAPAITTPNSWRSWAWQQVTPVNIVALAAGVGASYWVYKNFTRKDIEDGFKRLMKKLGEK